MVSIHALAHIPAEGTVSMNLSHECVLTSPPHSAESAVFLASPDESLSHTSSPHLHTSITTNGISLLCFCSMTTSDTNPQPVSPVHPVGIWIAGLFTSQHSLCILFLLFLQLSPSHSAEYQDLLRPASESNHPASPQPPPPLARHPQPPLIQDMQCLSFILSMKDTVPPRTALQNIRRLPWVIRPAHI